MRFGLFIFAVSLDSQRDGEVISKTLRQVEFAEELGFDAVFLAEHHFDGSSAYVDPVVFAAALAAKTTSIEIGFAVVQLALHHPVRLAEQTALIDQLSGGRLIVGTGRGSLYNIFEYLGYGVSIEDGADMAAESEDLLLKAWTQTNVRHEGKFWQSRFGEIRPRPYRDPHPELVRAAMSQASVTEMARLGRPILMGSAPSRLIADRFALYKAEMKKAGFDDKEIAQRMSRSWVARGACLAPTDEEAIEIGTAAHLREFEHATKARERWNPSLSAEKLPAGYNTPPSVEEDLGDTLLAGSPDTLRKHLADLEASGVPNVFFQMDIGDMDEHLVRRSMKLFAEEVMPEFS